MAADPKQSEFMEDSQEHVVDYDTEEEDEINDDFLRVNVVYDFLPLIHSGKKTKTPKKRGLL